VFGILCPLGTGFNEGEYSGAGHKEGFMRQFYSYLLNFGVSGIILFLIATWKLWAPKVIGYAFDKKIIKYKTDLETEKEKQLAEYGKSITGFNKFFDKKYEIYPQMYAEVMKLQSELSEWAPMQFFPDLGELTVPEFIDFLDSFRFTKPDRRYLIERKESGLVTDKDILDSLPRHFDCCMAVTNNFYVLNRLFLSEEIIELVEQFLSKAQTICSCYRGVFGVRATGDKWDEIEEKCKENYQVLKSMFSQMHSELENSNQSKREQ
jgi:hypothetical protein